MEKQSDNAEWSPQRLPPVSRGLGHQKSFCFHSVQRAQHFAREPKCLSSKPKNVFFFITRVTQVPLLLYTVTKGFVENHAATSNDTTVASL